MNIVKYNFNPKTLKFDKVTFSFKTFFLKKLIPHFTISIILGAIIALLATYNLISPQKSNLQYTNNILKYKYQLLDKKINKISKTITNLENNDDNVYRQVFGAAPIPKSIRNSGYGGSDRYEGLKGYDNSKQLIEISKGLDIISKKIIVQSKSYDEIITLVKDKEKMLACIPAIQPISNEDMTRFGSPFGYRVHPIYHTVRMHTGVDLTAPKGTPVYASGDGVVVRADASSRGYGNHIRISHGYGYITLYGHLTKMLVKAGQKVKRGELIGLVGSTGLSTSPHLHYEVRINDNPVNPMKYLYNEPVNPVNFYYNDLSDEEYQRMIEESATAQTHLFE